MTTHCRGNAYAGEVFDYAYLSVDGEPKGSLDEYQLKGVAIGGKTEWTKVVYDIMEEGEHTVRWTYAKDEVDESDVGDDCVWLDEVSLDPLVTLSFALHQDGLSRRMALRDGHVYLEILRTTALQRCAAARSETANPRLSR